VKSSHWPLSGKGSSGGVKSEAVKGEEKKRATRKAVKSEGV
jgi:hypothetical protein